MPTERGAKTMNLNFNVKCAVAAMQSARLTQGYEQALETGNGPSQQSLPEQMRRQSGSAVSRIRGHRV